MTFTPEVNPVITLNNGHIAQHTFELLKREPDENNLGLTVYQRFDENKNVTGMYVYFNADELETRYKNIPNDLKDCMALARDFGGHVIIFTHDGPVVPYMIIYDSPVKNSGSKLKIEHMATVSPDHLDDEAEKWLLGANMANYPFDVYPKQGTPDGERFGMFVHITDKTESPPPMPFCVKLAIDEAIKFAIDIICFDVDA